MTVQKTVVMPSVPWKKRKDKDMDRSSTCDVQDSISLSTPVYQYLTHESLNSAGRIGKPPATIPRRPTLVR
jgi:hypothetical protein